MGVFDLDTTYSKVLQYTLLSYFLGSIVLNDYIVCIIIT